MKYNNNYKEQISSLLEKISGVKNPQVEFSANEEFGDYSTNICLKDKDLNIDKIVLDINKESKTFIAEKLGRFINFKLNSDVLVSNLMSIDTEKSKYGTSKILKDQKVVLEFTDPNPFKEFHIGHVYTNTVGESLSRILEANGAEVRRVNYQGDVGLHVAKALWGLMFKMNEDSITLSDLSQKDLKTRVKYMGEGYAVGSKKYEEDPKIKEEINTLNKKIFAKDPEVIELYNTGRKWSLEYFETIYKRLGTKFDNYYFESEVGKVGEKIVKENLGKVFKESEGAVIFPGKKHGLHDRVFINSLGLPTYEAKELGLAPTKYKDFRYDLSVIITGNEINEYFKVLIKAMSLIYPELGEKTKHIGHGMVRLPEGKMSSRTGKIVTGEQLLNSVRDLAEKINKESSEMVSIAAVKYAFLKVGIGKDIVYNINESLSLEGNSGPYIQYSIARCNSVIQKAHDTNDDNLHDDKSLVLTNEESAVIRKLSQFQDVIISAGKNYSPSVLCTYLYELAQRFNTFYNAHKIIGGENENFKILLTKGTGQVLKNGLNLLGIESPEKM